MRRLPGLDDDARHLVFERDRIRVMLNLGEEAWRRAIPAGARMLLASDDRVKGARGHVDLPPSSVAIVEVLDA